MAKREISSTLKNLKFMQRGAAKVEKPKEKEEEEAKPNGNFFSRGGVRKCVVVMEGDPHPGAVIGRMSFGSFNPSVDKLNDAATNPTPPEAAGQAANSSASRENANGAESSETVTPNSDQKRKQPDGVSEMENSNSNSNTKGGEGSSRNNTKKGSFRQKRQKLDFNALRAKTRNN
ncbi:hypothetical protein LINGRAHAP2_LOCUS26494 [Linum grandiflorum]